MAKKEEQELPPIVIKKKVSHGGHHGGAWKVAYADFVTAMMSLFIVLWIVAQKKEVKQAVSEYFKDPVAASEKAKSGKGKGEGPSAGTIKRDTVVSDTSGQIAAKKKFEELKKSLEAAIMTIPQLERMKNQITIEMVPEGLRIEMAEGKQFEFFDVGKATVKTAAEQFLVILAQNLKSLPNPLIIEGHTDSRAYSFPGGYTNWELSTERANAARRILVEHGIPDERFSEIRGYADRHLKNPKDPLDVANRRVSITVAYMNNQKPTVNSGGASTQTPTSQSPTNHSPPPQAASPPQTHR